ncbi:hypothetical protein L7F22_063101 [Adiantum nelumboides]|nr:hypothetical protein [Adiantum nelumboides]
MPEPIRAQAQVMHNANSMETPIRLSESMQTPKPMPIVQKQVAGMPVSQAIPVQPATFQQPNVGSNGQGSSWHAMQQVFPPPSIYLGYFGGGSAFQSRAGHAPGNQYYTLGTVFGGAQGMMPNPMYSIGMQRDFQSTKGQFGMPYANFGKPTPYEGGGEGVTFSTFSGFDDRKKALSFFQQFDRAYAGGNVTEASKPGHIATNCPQRKRPVDSEDKEDMKGKKPMACLEREKSNSDVSELCRAWGKVRDQTVLIFFDPGAKTNFISPKLVSKLGMRHEEMAYTVEARSAKCYVSEHKAKWEQYLPLVEYAYNNTMHSSTGKAPFEVVEGCNKVPPILHTTDKIFEADKYVQDMDEMYKKVKVALEKTQAKQKKAADCHCREVVFSLGDWVLLRFEKARLKKMKGKEKLFPKLSTRYYGPFQVCDKISDIAYGLKLPENWKIHNAFHVSFIRPYVSDVPEDMPAEEQPEIEELNETLVPD